MDASRGPSSIFFLIVNVLTVAAAILSVWNATNMIFEHTFLLPADAPGTLSSDRFSAFWWLLQAALALRLVLVVAAALRIATPPNGLYRLAHLIWAIVTFVFEIVFLVFHIVEIGACNAASGGSAVCNDYRWCCVFGPVFPAPANAQCPYLLAPCAPAVAAGQLAWNGPFLLSFVLVIAFIVLALLHIVFNFVMGRGLVRAVRAPDGTLVATVPADEDAAFMTPADEAGLEDAVEGRYDPRRVEAGLLHAVAGARGGGGSIADRLHLY